jgi:hypothetical protein
MTTSGQLGEGSVRSGWLTGVSVARGRYGVSSPSAGGVAQASS